MIPFRLSRALLGLALIVAVIAPSTVSVAAGKVHVVQMLNKSTTNKKERMVFEPSVINIDVGDTVRFVSKDRGHNTASIKGMLPSGAEKWKSRIGKDFEVTYTADGTYGYMCSPHYGLGMVGVVLVGDYSRNLEQVAAKRHPSKARKRFDKMFAKIRAMEPAETSGATN